jgi:hypothetical protein
MPRKPECEIDGCSRHQFATTSWCLPHFRAMSITLDVDDTPLPAQAAAAPTEPVGEPVLPSQPTVTSPKPAWVDWVVHRHGVSRETAEQATKRQLIDLDRGEHDES